MSLWEKWEREKLEKQGIKVEHPRDVTIRETHPKRSARRQALLIAGAFLACILFVLTALALEPLVSGRRWSDSLIVRLFAEREKQREEMSRNR